MATTSPIPGDSGYENAWNEMRQFVLNSFEIPPDTIQGATALSQAYATEWMEQKATEQQNPERN